jgi:CRP/FNR family transcriptional regulator, cyclic AMP receptor protein
MRKALVILGILDDSDVEWMISAGKRERMAAGSMLIQEGHSSDHLYIVVEGAFAVRLGALQGKQIAELRAGEMVGEMSFVDARAPSASVVALEESLVLSIPVASLRDRLNDPPFAARFYRALAVLLANRLRNTVTSLGYGRASNDREEAHMGEEIGPTMLETLGLAGARLDLMMKRLRGE